MLHFQFQTERLILQPLTPNDSNFIFKLVNTEGWLKNIGDRNVHSIADAVGYIQKIVNNPNYYCIVVRLKESHQSIGVVTLVQRDFLPQPDIGFALLPAFENQGYAFEAAHLFIKVITESKMYNSLLSITIPENIASIKLITKLGFQFQNQIVNNNENLLLYKKEI